jgi:anti-sigma factor RsiW
MFDFLRNLTKTAGEKQQELLNAYLDDALGPRQRQRFERQLAQDAQLQQSLAQQRLLKEQLRQLPRRRVPRNFTLDPATYGRPQREPLLQLYPALRLATVLTAFFFVLAIGLGTFSGQAEQSMAPSAADVAMTAGEPAAEAPAEEMAAEAPAEGVAEEAAAEFVEVTRVVTEEIVVEEGEPVEVEVVTESEEVVVEVEEEAAEAENDQAAELRGETEIPTEPVAEPAVAAEVTDTEVAEESATAPAEIEGETAVGAADTPTAAPTSVATKSSFAPTATTSAVPRTTLPVEGQESDRAVAASQATAEALEDVETIVMVTPEATVPPPAAPTATSFAFSGLQWLQLGLGIVFVLLVAVTLIARRRFQ